MLEVCDESRQVWDRGTVDVLGKTGDRQEAARGLPFGHRYAMSLARSLELNPRSLVTERACDL